MWGQKELRAHLRERLDVGDRQLRRLIAKRATELPSTNEQALFVLAHEAGLRLQNYLMAEQIAEVRGLTQGRNVVLPTTSSNKAPKSKRTSSKRTVGVAIAGVKIGEIPGLKQSHAAEAKAMAERVYPTLYLFENSVRDVIERVLSAKYGVSWWSAAVSPRVRAKAEQFKTEEEKDTWHGKRGRRDLDYLTLSQLWTIIRDRWKDFEPLFPQGAAWVQALIESDMNVSRRVVAHMNPLGEDDIKGLEASFRKWIKHLKAVEDKLP